LWVNVADKVWSASAARGASEWVDQSVGRKNEKSPSRKRLRLFWSAGTGLATSSVKTSPF